MVSAAKSQTMHLVGNQALNGVELLTPITAAGGAFFCTHPLSPQSPTAVKGALHVDGLKVSW